MWIPSLAISREPPGSRPKLESFAYLVGALANIKEGDGTLLDRTLVWRTGYELAQVHSLSGMPMLTAGSAGGRVKTGIHVDGKGGPGTQVSLTRTQAMGVQATGGRNSMKTQSCCKRSVGLRDEGGASMKTMQ